MKTNFTKVPQHVEGKTNKETQGSPDSDTKDGKGYIIICVLFSTFLLAINIPNVVSLSKMYVSTEDVGRLYSVYLQGIQFQSLYPQCPRGQELQKYFDRFSVAEMN